MTAGNNMRALGFSFSGAGVGAMTTGVAVGGFALVTGGTSLAPAGVILVEGGAVTAFGGYLDIAGAALQGAASGNYSNAGSAAAQTMFDVAVDQALRAPFSELYDLQRGLQTATDGPPEPGSCN